MVGFCAEHTHLMLRNMVKNPFQDSELNSAQAILNNNISMFKRCLCVLLCAPEQFTNQMSVPSESKHLWLQGGSSVTCQPFAG
jgi:hypothetical protein